MPSWKVHEKWACLFGINPVIVRAVNALIDKLWPHDIGRRRASDDYYVRALIISKYGYEGYAAYLLHHILDYIDWWIKKKGRIPSIERIERRFSRMLPVGAPYITRHGHLGITRWGVHHIDYAAIRVFNEVISFVKTHIDEIVEDIRSS